MEAIHPTLKKCRKGDFTEAAEHLFGETFKEIQSLVKKVEADSVLSKAVNIVTRSSKGHEDHHRRTSSRYGRQSKFFWEPDQQVRGCVQKTIQPVQYSQQSVVHRNRETDHRSPLFQEKRSFQSTETTEGPTRITTTRQ